MLKYILLFIVLAVSPCSAESQISWNQPMNIAAVASGNDHPRIVTDASGNPLVIWHNASRVMFSRWNGTAFESPRIINPVSMTVAGATWMGPDIAAKGDTIYVVFKQTPEHTGFSYLIHSYDGGLNFSDPVRIDFIGDSLSRFPTVAVDAAGNPVVAFMKFNSTFGDASWAVARSDDFGNSFSSDVLASGWSSQSSVVCDCCPGSLVSTHDTIIMLYRDNKNNIRDTWAGFSSDGGASFTKGANVDQHNWNIMVCPATGPDGVILGDTLYSTFMSGASGQSRVYFNKTPVSNFSSSLAVPLTGNISGLTTQNFPRISGEKHSVGIVWVQRVNGKDQLVMNFIQDVRNGSIVYDTIDFDNIENADITIRNGKVFVVWEDTGTGTVKFRSGTYEFPTAIDDKFENESIVIYPNPSSAFWTISGEGLKPGLKIELLDVNGQLIHFKILSDHSPINIDNKGLPGGTYLLRLSLGEKQHTHKLIKL